MVVLNFHSGAENVNNLKSRKAIALSNDTKQSTQESPVEVLHNSLMPVLVRHMGRPKYHPETDNDR